MDDESGRPADGAASKRAESLPAAEDEVNPNKRPILASVAHFSVASFGDLAGPTVRALHLSVALGFLPGPRRENLPRRGFATLTGGSASSFDR